ncbi:hypothetical protein [Gordonia shandongensis]|uniref:hypothetical protein n=1 Tax=Gordonia shandongensis TaxID=376351 RepID=UPI0003FB60AA|nr:hypothetical protein [Gordonia shandongensis]
MEPFIEYVFGTGSGPVSRWASAADLDLDGGGTPDAVLLDFDGDGRRDDAMWDSDGDGIADMAVLDLDDDGVPETFFADGGSGLWELPRSDDVGGAILLDTDGDGYADTHRATTGRATADRTTAYRAGAPDSPGDP